MMADVRDKRIDLILQQLDGLLDRIGPGQGDAHTAVLQCVRLGEQAQVDRRFGCAEGQRIER